MKSAVTGSTFQMGKRAAGHAPEVALERIHAGPGHVAPGDEWNVLGAGDGQIEPLSDDPAKPWVTASTIVASGP